LSCTRAGNLDKNFPDLVHEPRDTAYSSEGTHAHAVAEALIKYKDMIDISASNTPLTTYINYVNKFKNSKTYTVKIEKRLDCTRWVPECYGTADALAWDGFECHVIDLKYGTGVRVEAKHNTQALIYALGCLNLVPKSVNRFTMHIIQPRIENGISTWSISREELLYLGKKIKERAILAYEGEGEFNPNEDTCRWCPAKKICPAIIADKFKDL
jgi:hypothetical protein